MPNIHAAANRIPVLRTDSQLRDLPELWDNEPSTLDHYAPRTWSGSIRFSITAKTPLVYGNVDEQTGAISIPTTTHTKAGTTPHEIPILPATMVKGMLSNAFERVTSSRLRVFGDYSKPLTYRMDPAECQQLVPAFAMPTKGEAILLTGTHPRLREIKLEHNSRVLPVMMAATLRTKQGENTRFAPGMNNKRLLAMIRPRKGERYRQVQFDAKLVDNGTYAYWFIYALYTNSETSERVPIFDENTLTGEDLQQNLTKQIGYVYLTTDPDDLSTRPHSPRRWQNASFSRRHAFRLRQQSFPPVHKTNHRQSKDISKYSKVIRKTGMPKQGIHLTSLFGRARYYSPMRPTPSWHTQYCPKAKKGTR